MNKKFILIALIVIFAAVAGVGTYWKYYLKPSSVVTENQTSKTPIIKNIPVENNKVASSASEPIAEKQKSVINQTPPKGFSIKGLHFEFVADESDPKILMGGSQYVFVAKILRQVGNETNIAWMPKTQFEAEVISNIKGNVQGKIIVSQVGGFYNGVLYVANGDLLGPANSPSAGRLLQVGSTYLLPTRYLPSFSPYYGISFFPGTITLISNDPNLTMLQLKTEAESNLKYRELLEAYPNEILLSADIQHGYTQNSFQSLSTEQQTAVRNKILILSGVTPTFTSSSSTQ